MPIHPSCANSPRPVVNFIFFNKTKTVVAEVLKMYTCRAFMHSSHDIRYILLAVGMTSLEAIIKGGANLPRSLLYFIHRSMESRHFEFQFSVSVPLTPEPPLPPPHFEKSGYAPEAIALVWHNHAKRQACPLHPHLWSTFGVPKASCH